MNGRWGILLLGAICAAASAARGGVTVGTQITYQGQLKEDGAPVNNSADFQFSLWAHVSDTDPADQVGSTIPVSNVTVVNGLFTVSLDFGANAFTGADRWLQVAVRIPHDPGNVAPFTTLAARQPVSPAPYAIKAFSAVGVDGHSLDAADGNPLDAVFVDNSGNVSVDFRLIFSPGSTPLMTAGHDNNVARPKRMWIAHSEVSPEWGIQYRDLSSDGFSADTIEFVAGDDTLPRFRFDLPNRNIDLLDSNGRATTRLNGQAGEGGGGMTMLNSLGNQTVEVDADESDSSVIRLNSSTAQNRVYIAASEGAEGAEMHLRNASGVTTIQLDADVGGSGDGRVITSELQITGGSDLSEQFEVNAQEGTEGQRDEGTKVGPGIVVSIDPRRPGELIVSTRAYDRSVAGVVSGAGGVKPGMLMGQTGTLADGKHPIALSGRVYCWCDASRGAIAPGDSLTTSDVPGHAMKVTDHDRAQGAIIGKAMTALEEGQDLVLVLVSLQ